MNKKTKTTLQFALAGILFASFAVVSCNNGNESTETKTDTVVTEKPMEVTPPAAPVDTTKKDTVSIRPTPTGS